MIDLHTHSTVSDGTVSPAGVVRLAAEAGCSAVALTDHDRLDGLAEAAAQGDLVGVRVVPGCELSCAWEPGTMHVLVYFVEEGGGPLQDRLGELQRVRDERNVRMVAALQAAGLPVTLDEVKAEAGGDGVGRPHAAAVLVAKGLATSVNDAFDRWLAKGRPGYVEKQRLSPAEAMALARGSGGVPVLAHPLSLGVEGLALASAIRELADLGLQGIEAVYGRYRPDERTALAEVAAGAGLAITGGSDFHGTYKPDLQVGVARGDLAVPDGLLDELEARRP